MGTCGIVNSVQGIYLTKGKHPYSTCHEKRQFDVSFHTHTHTLETSIRGNKKKTR